jgi:hypothetical protein
MARMRTSVFMTRKGLWGSVLCLVCLVFLAQWISRLFAVTSRAPHTQHEPVPAQVPMPPPPPALPRGTRACTLPTLGPPFVPCLYHFDQGRDALADPVVFPDCAPVSWLPPPADLFNPLDTWPPRVHHPIVRRFLQYHGPVDREYLTDWLGVRTAFAHECAGGPGQAFAYMEYVPSRRFQCERHCRLVADDIRTAPGEMPLFDDEYPEWVDMLASVERTPANYVVVELGARLGTWGVRALAAHQQRWGPGNATFLGVESEGSYYRAMHHHTRINGFAMQSILIQAFAEKRLAHEGLDALLRHVDHVDYLDVDIQSSEGTLFLNASRERLRARVGHVHVGTHSPALHAQMRAFFQHELGWRKLIDLPWNQRGECDRALVNSIQRDRSCLVQTRMGALYVRDGMLAFANPRLVPQHWDANYTLLAVV